ncbi:MAG: urease accessory protein UreH [Caldiserica bacterium]|nr:urease accessory protein UreH [Caldisericota bacterium]
MEVFQVVTLLALGFVLGLKHALDADHVVAVSTIVSQVKSIKKSSLFGAIWGVGHTTTLLLVGLLILILKIAIPDKVASSFEFIVGIVLVVLGIDVLRKVIRDKIHFHKHQHGEVVHTHLHSHRKSFLHSHVHKSFLVGVVHGLAGSAALMLLVLTTIKSVFLGALYILIFGVGSILGMLVIGGIISLPFLFTAKSDRVNSTVKILAGTISILLGITIMYKIGFLGGLFV